MSDYLRLVGGEVYDPRHGINGEIRDLWISGGKMVAAPENPQQHAVRTLDLQGMVVMPGGIDMHCHIAGPKVNTARKMRPEEKRRDPPQVKTAQRHSGTLGSCPSTFTTGYLYSGLGYTTAFDAAVPPLTARHAHEEFQDTPCLDKGFYVLLGNHHYVMRSIAEQQPAQLQNFLGWLLGAAKGYAPKLVNPGGVEVWKQRQAGDVKGIDDPVGHFHVTPRQIVREVSRTANQLQLPHPVHIHCNNLGMPGNWTTTLETMRSLEGHQGHITHIQFHSYGGGNADEDTFRSQVAPLAEFVNSNPHVSVDVGQVMFGETTSMTGDGPLGYFLHNVYGGKWFNADTELEAGCGIAPIKYRNKSLVHALQWAIGLEWYLMVQDPWRIAMSTDHPNGGSFLAYPEIIALLMDRAHRQDALAAAHPAIRERTQLETLNREYSLQEICIITRAAPAKLLGLSHKGHLGPGADADITVYSTQADKRRMFELPRYVIKAGEVLVEDGELRYPRYGHTLHVAPAYDRDFEPRLAEWFNDHYTVRFQNYPVAAHYLDDPVEVPCGKRENSSTTTTKPAADSSDS